MTDEANYAAVLEHLAQAAASGEPGIYLGQTVHGDLPVVLPLKTFNVHGSNRGASDSGKTLQVMRMIYQRCMLQAPGRPACGAEDCSIVCIDMKGDRALFNHNRVCAELAGMEFKYFDTRPGSESYLFNPLSQSHHRHMSRLQRAQEVANALGFLHGADWSKAYFGAQNAELTFVPLDAVGPDGEPRFRTYREVSHVYAEPRLFAALPGARMDNLKEGSHVVTTMKLLGKVHAMNLTKDLMPERPDAFTHAIDAGSLFYKKQFVQVTVPFASDPLIGGHIARQLCYCVFNAGQFARDRKCRVLVFVDEAQHAVSRQFIQLFEQARGFGITIVLVHQHRGQLADVGGEDQRLAIDTNTAWSLDFDVASAEMIKFIQDHSPRGIFASPSWSRQASGIAALDAWDEYTFAKALRESDKVEISTQAGPLFDSGTILKLNARGDVGWVRVRVNRGSMRLVGVVPFHWRYHLTEGQYRKLETARLPGPSDRTITVQKEPFDGLPPPVTDLTPRSPIVPKPTPFSPKTNGAHT